MGLNLVEALIVEHSHQTGICRCTIRILNLQAPFLLLSRSQTIAEGLPRQTEFLVGHRTLDRLLMTIAYSLLHPCIGKQQPIAVFLLVFELTINQLTILLYLTLLYYLVVCIDGVEDV